MKLETVVADMGTRTIYRDGNYAIKAFDSCYSKADVLGEALNQARVEETGLNVPHLCEVKQVEGKWSIISEMIDGTTLNILMEKNPDRFDEYLEKFVDLQLTVHHHSCPALNRIKDKMNRQISRSGLDAATRYELHTRLESMPTHNKLCHGDFDPYKIIIRDDGQAFIIDWAQATQGNASADAAKTYLLFWLRGDSDGADKYLKLFCKKSDTAKQYVQKWIPIVAACQSVWGKPEEREPLLHWVNVVDYE